MKIKILLILLMAALLGGCYLAGPEVYQTIYDATGSDLKEQPQPQIYLGVLTAIVWADGKSCLIRHDRFYGWSVVYDEESFREKIADLLYIHIEEFKPHVVEDEKTVEESERTPWS